MNHHDSHLPCSFATWILGFEAPIRGFQAPSPFSHNVGATSHFQRVARTTQSRVLCQNQLPVLSITMAWWKENYYKTVKKGGHTVYLGGSELGNGGATQVARALRDPTTRVQTLCLQHSKIGVEGAIFIANSLRKNSTLKVLLLDYNNVGNDGAKAIANALTYNSTLERLGLSNNHIGDDGATAIAMALRLNSKMQEVSLDNNHVGDERATVIANALKCNSTLQGLDLCRNDITVHGAPTTQNALKIKASLQELYLYKSDFGVYGAKVTVKELQFMWNNVSTDKSFLRTPTYAESVLECLTSCCDIVAELMKAVWLECERCKAPTANLFVLVTLAVVYHHAITHHAFDRILCTLVHDEAVQMDLFCANLLGLTRHVRLVYDDIWRALCNIIFAVTLAVFSHYALEMLSIKTYCEAGAVMALVVASHCAVIIFCPLVFMK